MRAYEAYDSNNSCSMGYDSETTLAEVANKYNYTFRDSEDVEDYRDHIDCYLEKNGKKWSLDVKGRKRKARWQDNVDDMPPEDVWLWVEFKNVQGSKGWLYGKADLIAFELQDKYIIVRRKDLVNLSEKVVDMEYKVLKSYRAEHKVYSRASRPKELTAMINLEDLMTIKHYFWDK